MSAIIDRTCYNGLKKSLKEVSTRSIIIKINMVSVYNELSMTPKKCLMELIEYIMNDLDFNGKIIIAEGPAIGSAFEGFRRLGLLELRKNYNLDFLDIHEDETVEIPIFDSKLNEFYIPISRTLLKSEFLLSVCRAKTHDTVITTLSIKNVAVGGIVGKINRPRIHQGYRAINVNIAILAALMYPDYSLIDGRVGMEGNGPVSGSRKDWGVIFSGKNPVEVDSLASYCMGFDPRSIGYLYYLNKLGLGEINISGEKYPSISKIKTSFKPHYKYEEQLKWRLPIEEEQYVIERTKKIVVKYGGRSIKKLMYSDSNKHEEIS